MSIKTTIAEKARKYIAEDAFILDTETTGIDDAAEIVEIAIINASGTLQFSSLVKPSVSIPEGASKIHGIYDQDVQFAPTWREIQPIVAEIIGERRVLAFNAAYDSRLIDQSARISNAPMYNFQWGCLMEAYQAFTFRTRWSKLTDAAREIGFSSDGAHRAMADCKMARAILFHMAAYQEIAQQPLIELAPATAYEAGE